MKSMTGYGRGECVLYSRKFIVEIKAVNHRYNDINIKLPRALFSYEESIKKVILERVFRGKIDVYISFETFSEDDIKVNVNQTLAKSYINALNDIKQKFNIHENISLNLISRFPEVINVEKNISNENEKEEIWECLLKALIESVNNFLQMREFEGNHLKNNIVKKLQSVLEYLHNIQQRAPLVSEDYKKRITQRITELKELVDSDESRIITEVAIFADKICIDEELTRMYSHIKQMENILEEDVSVGRKLDFLVQEMNREVNTIGSKSNDLEITNNIVQLKSEIEKIREQIQNIE